MSGIMSGCASEPEGVTVLPRGLFIRTQLVGLEVMNRYVVEQMYEENSLRQS